MSKFTVYTQDTAPEAAKPVLHEVKKAFGFIPNLQAMPDIGHSDDGTFSAEKVIALKPDNAHAHNALGYSLADRNMRLEEARQLITQAVQLAPQDPYIQDSLGWLEFRQGRLQQALQILQAAYKAKPDAEIAAHLGEVLWALGQQQAAGTLWREGLLLKPDNETLVDTIQRFQFKP